MTSSDYTCRMSASQAHLHIDLAPPVRRLGDGVGKARQLGLDRRVLELLAQQALQRVHGVCGCHAPLGSTVGAGQAHPLAEVHHAGRLPVAFLVQDHILRTFTPSTLGFHT